MARSVFVQLVDDLDGRDADESVSFALDGVEYEIDLSEANAARLRELLAEVIAHARREGRSPSRPAGVSTARTNREHLKAMREWANNNGFRVSGMGRIPHEVQRAFREAHASAPVATKPSGSKRTRPQRTAFSAGGPSTKARKTKA